MRMRGLLGIGLALAVLGVAAAASADVEENKFVALLRVQTDGAILVTVRDPKPSTLASCTWGLLALPDGLERDRMYSLLLAAKTSMRPVSIEFSSCSITNVALP
jgi:hypothetical protein